MERSNETLDILGREEWVRIFNPAQQSRAAYLLQVSEQLEEFEGDVIAVSAGFDNHQADWGGVLSTDDYRLLGLDVGIRARMLGARCFGVLEGGYDHGILGECVHAFLHGLNEGWTHGVSGVRTAGPPERRGPVIPVGPGRSPDPASQPGGAA